MFPVSNSFINTQWKTYFNIKYFNTEISSRLDKDIDTGISGKVKNLYFSFGYNQVDIDYEKSQFVDNLLNLNFTINEGKISKINKVYFKGNDSFKKK